jgi:hypothetical protein
MISPTQRCAYCELDEVQRGLFRCRICGERLALARQCVDACATARQALDAPLRDLAAEFDYEIDGHDPNSGRTDKEAGSALANSPAFQTFGELADDLWYSMTAGKIASSLSRSLQNAVRMALVESNRRQEWLKRRRAIIEDARISLLADLGRLGLSGDDAATEGDIDTSIKDTFDAAPLRAAAERLSSRCLSIRELPGIVLDAADIGERMIDGWYIAMDGVEVEDELFHAAWREVGDHVKAEALAADLERRWRALGAPRDLLMWAREQSDRPQVGAPSLGDLLDDIERRVVSRRRAVRPADGLDPAARALRAHLRGTRVPVRRRDNGLVIGDGKAVVTIVDDDTYRVVVSDAGDKSIVALTTLDELRSDPGRRLCKLLST